MWKFDRMMSFVGLLIKIQLNLLLLSVSFPLIPIEFDIYLEIVKIESSNGSSSIP